MNILAVILSAVCLSVTFPTVIDGWRAPNLAALVWIGLVPLIMACRRASFRQIIVYIFVHAVLFNCLVSYWIFHAIYVYGQLSAPASLAGLIGAGISMSVVITPLWLLAFWLERRRALPLVIGLPVVWILNEWVRNFGPFGGYPWSQLAYSQVSFLGWIQSADIWSVYGLGFIIVFVNCTLSDLVESFVHRRKVPVLALIAAVIMIGANWGYGHWRLGQVEAVFEKAKELRVGVTQPNIPQEIKWKPGQASETMRIQASLSERAAEQGAELILWPESGYPDVIPTFIANLSELATWETPILSGAVTVLPINDQPRGARPKLHNSAIFVAADGSVLGMYHKSHLVPLGEYIPLKNIFRFLDVLVPAIGDFQFGTERNLMELNGIPFGVTICYEDLFPEISRSFVRDGAAFLTNVTNDAWYGDSSQVWQHLVFSQFRAVENRRSMIRSTNTGVSAFIEPTGVIQRQLPVLKRLVEVEDVAIGGPMTLYTRYGDALWLGLLGLLLVITGGIRHRMKTRHVSHGT